MQTNAAEAPQSDANQSCAEDTPIHLHIGGIEPRPGWSILNISPGPNVDVCGSCTDLGMFDDSSVQTVYASHVLEHLGYQKELPRALGEILRVLQPEGRLMLGVPDLEMLGKMISHPQLPIVQRIHVMRMIYGGQMDEYDFHKTGFTWDILQSMLLGAGFRSVRRVQELGVFDDTSKGVYCGHSISLNAIATA
ncbi:MAG: methyltransferase domain-containing protein [Pseudomonadota bacterium]